jgi:GntR family transcriptional regulator of vanillate catabolism
MHNLADSGDVATLSGELMPNVSEPRFIPAADHDSQTIRAVLAMRQMLMRGEFQCGQRLREIPLAELLNVSRTPARLALERLAHEGLLEARPKGGFVVREFTLQDILDAIEIRGALEGMAAQMAAERLESEAELDGMRECLEQGEALLRKTGSVLELMAAYSPINDRFHWYLVELAKSPILVRSMDQVRALPLASPSAFTASQAESHAWRETMTVAQFQHRGIVEAISTRAGTRAAAAAREHAGIGRRGLELALREKRLSEIPGGRLVRIPEPGKPLLAERTSP